MITITDGLLGEHGVFYAIFEHLESEAAGMEADALQAAGKALAVALISHARLENECLFPPLEQFLGPGGPVAVMRQEHDEIEQALLHLAGAGHAAAMRDRLLGAIAQAREHFAKEEQVLFPMAAQMLGLEKLRELGATWAARRGLRLA